MEKSEKNPTSLSMRADTATYIVFGLMIGVLLILSVLAFIKDASFWKLIAILLFIMAFCFLWISSYRIDLSDKELSYKVFLRRAKVILLSNIDKARIEMGDDKYTDRFKFKPTCRIVIVSRKNVSQKDILINMKVFKKLIMPFFPS